MQKLRQDLEILEAMAGQMAGYVKSEVLFWPLGGRKPQLTLGGYLMRQHRLLALANTLTEAEQQRLGAAISQFNQALEDKVVRFEQKAHRELEARIRQWNEYLRDLEHDRRSNVASYYATAVEARVMIAVIVDKLQSLPYQIQPRVGEQVELLDKNLRRFWQPGDFVWAAEWQPAYPPTDFWYLYGRLEGKHK